jgi:hypothetical protein
MNNFKELMFASVDIPILDCNHAAKEILALDDCVSFWDDYRYTKMIPLMTKSGLGIVDNDLQGEFNWLPHAPIIVKEWFDKVVFPWIGMPSRVMALITQPGVSNYEHIDCNIQELNTIQHKFRIVLQGRTDTLYFKTTKGDVFVPNISQAFVMDGGWPHGMTNATTDIKVTLALGAPWTGNKNYTNLRLLMNRNDYQMPSDLTKFWKSKKY